MPFAVASNPEFLKEGAAVEDFMRPDRVVIGADDERAIALLRAVYAPFQRNHERLLVMDVRSAELTKYAANAMLATRISFMNELANLADALGADIEQVRQGIGSDPRIGYHFLYPGAGYGGSCFPKDVKALQAHRARSTAGRCKHARRGRGGQRRAEDAAASTRSSQRLGDDLAGRTFALWGLAFKPNTDDMREAPSRAIDRGACSSAARRVVAYDPVAMAEARRVFGDARRDWRYRGLADGRGRGRRRAGRRHRVEGVPQPRLRRAEARRCDSRSCSTAATCTTRRRCAPPASNISASAAVATTECAASTHPRPQRMRRSPDGFATSRAATRRACWSSAT